MKYSITHLAKIRDVMEAPDQESALRLFRAKYPACLDKSVDLLDIHEIPLAPAIHETGPVFVNGFHLITIDTLIGPWHVGSRNDRYWYIVNRVTGRSRKIGPVRMRGTNYFDKAEEEADRRNKLIASKGV
jgi:hypothetical protein